MSAANENAPSQRDADVESSRRNDDAAPRKPESKSCPKCAIYVAVGVFILIAINVGIAFYLLSAKSESSPAPAEAAPQAGIVPGVQGPALEPSLISTTIKPILDSIATTVSKAAEDLATVANIPTTTVV